jgi:hypothetical protein
MQMSVASTCGTRAGSLPSFPQPLRPQGRHADFSRSTTESDEDGGGIATRKRAPLLGRTVSATRDGGGRTVSRSADI